MGWLENQRTGVRFELRSEISIGRASESDLLLEGARVSKGHALIRWCGDRFVVRDKGSTNGTWLNQKRLSVGQDTPLSVGDLLEFGGQDEPWTCVDGAPPTDGAALMTDRLRYSLADSVLRVGPPNTVYLTAGGQPFKLSLSPGEYDVVQGLVAQRLEDRAQGVSREGWISRKDFGDRVCNSVPTLNQHIKRLRDKIRKLDILAEEATEIIEQVDGEIRIGVTQLVSD